MDIYESSRYFEQAERDCEKILKNLIEINETNFFESIAKRGEEYFQAGKVKDLQKITEDAYEAKVSGSEMYRVIVKMNGKYCYQAECTCPFNNPNTDYSNMPKCKHIYATYKTIYHLQNKEFLITNIPKYLDQYYAVFLKLKQDEKELKIDKSYIKIYKDNIKDFNNIYEGIQNILNQENDIKILTEKFTNFLIESGKIFDILSNINKLNEERKQELAEKAKTKEESILKENIDEYEENQEYQGKNGTSSFWEILEYILGGNNKSMSKNSNSQDEFEYGDVVYVNYSGKIGVVVSRDGEFYIVKLKNEDGTEYYATYRKNELKKYY